VIQHQKINERYHLKTVYFDIVVHRYLNVDKKQKNDIYANCSQQVSQEKHALVITVKIRCTGLKFFTLSIFLYYSLCYYLAFKS